MSVDADATMHPIAAGGGLTKGSDKFGPEAAKKAAILAAQKRKELENRLAALTGPGTPTPSGGGGGGGGGGGVDQALLNRLDNVESDIRDLVSDQSLFTRLSIVESEIESLNSALTAKKLLTEDDISALKTQCQTCETLTGEVRTLTGKLIDREKIIGILNDLNLDDVEIGAFKAKLLSLIPAASAAASIDTEALNRAVNEALEKSNMTGLTKEQIIGKLSGAFVTSDDVNTRIKKAINGHKTAAEEALQNLNDQLVALNGKNAPQSEITRVERLIGEVKKVADRAKLATDVIVDKATELLREELQPLLDRVGTLEENKNRGDVADADAMANAAETHATEAGKLASRADELFTLITETTNAMEAATLAADAAAAATEAAGAAKMATAAARSVSSTGAPSERADASAEAAADSARAASASARAARKKADEKQQPPAPNPPPNLSLIHI